MNERWKKLWSEAAELETDDSWAGQTKFMEKFALLIIQDCIDVVDGYTKPRTFNTHYDAVEQIQHLFGIEERKGWRCPKCGVDRTREACPKGHTAAITGDCPMTASAQSGVEL